MIGVTLFFSIAFGAIALGLVILGLTFRQWLRLRNDKKLS